MIAVLSPGQMYVCDRNAIEGGTPSPVLMERAAAACVEALLERHPTLSAVFVLCGTGNNGGDGLIAARLLRQRGIAADICVMGDPCGLHPVCARAYADAREAGAGEVSLSALETTPYDAVVDALFGIGLSREVTGAFAAAVEAVNQSGLPVLSVDIPSGVNAMDGQILGCAVRADVTVTMAAPKAGLYLYPGASLAGEIVCADIGIPVTLPAGEAPLYRMMEEADVNTFLPTRCPWGNKGTFGRVLCVAGSKNMSGAAYFCAKAAYRTGAGLVELFTPEENRVILQTQLPEAVMTTYDAAAGEASLRALLETSLRRADAVVIGPGLGTGEAALCLVRTVLAESTVPTVIDADALNLISLHALMMPKDLPLVLTPHPGELARLTGMPVSTLLADLRTHAMTCARTHGVILAAKDARTVITDGEDAYLNPTGSSALAKGGSGDVLAGIIGGLLASAKVEGRVTKETAYRMAVLGVYLHGRAGERAAARFGVRGVLASETADRIWGEPDPLIKQ